MEDNPTTELLQELVSRKHVVLSRIQKLVQTQIESIDARRSSELLPLLSAKQNLLDELGIIERQLDPFRKDDPDARHWESAEDRENCAVLVAENRRMLQEILEAEQNCEKQLVAQRDDTTRQLDENASAAQAIKAYQQIEKPHKPRLDLSSEG